MTTADAIILLTALNPATAERLGDIIDRQATRHHIDPLLVVAVIYHESRFHRWARAGRNHGYMQVRISRTNYPRWRGKTREVYLPDVNIRLGVKLLAWWRWYCLTRCRHTTPHHWWSHYQHGRKVTDAGSGERVAETYGRLKR